ncbi:hypothetical protein B0H66DRAFT_560725 [Apodospora peruviana]|uniref:Uncharacterized protein n=1 Tax=Apodospora peruviana TaxID=516989 RepID=A0AAE0I0E7_9PEZI|nr:hypothetical protein B0H66DRAFT_560725 [Apodospora peruviana]
MCLASWKFDPHCRYDGVDKTSHDGEFLVLAGLLEAPIPPEAHGQGPGARSWRARVRAANRMKPMMGGNCQWQKAPFVVNASTNFKAVGFEKTNPGTQSPHPMSVIGVFECLKNLPKKRSKQPTCPLRDRGQDGSWAAQARRRPGTGDRDREHDAVSCLLELVKQIKQDDNSAAPSGCTVMSCCCFMMSEHHRSAVPVVA